MNILKVDSLAAFSSEGYGRVPIDGARGLLRLLCFDSEQSVALHRHPKADEYFYVVQGKGKLTVGNEEAEVGPGSIVRVPAGVLHRWQNGPQRLILFSVLVPPSSYELGDEATRGLWSDNIPQNAMRCKCGREVFLLSTAQQWRRDDWIVTDKYCCSSCGTMYISENDKTWQIPIKQ